MLMVGIILIVLFLRIVIVKLWMCVDDFLVLDFCEEDFFDGFMVKGFILMYL